MKNIDVTNINSLKKLQESFNSAFDKQINDVKYTNNINIVKGMSFGNLKNIFGSISNKIYENDNSLKHIKNYIIEMKSSNELKTLNNLYESIKSPKNITNTDIFVNQVDSIFESLNKKKSKIAVKRLANIVAESLKSVISDNETLEKLINESNNDFNKSFNFLSENSKTANNLIEYSNSIGIILEHVSGHNRFDAEENKDSISESISDIDVSNMKDYEVNAMKSLVECYLSQGSEEELFESYKNESMANIDEAIESADVETKSRLILMKEKLNERKYNEEAFIDDILKLSELKNTLQ